MTLILHWFENLHQTRGDSPINFLRVLAVVDLGSVVNVDNEDED